eukprot:TRINITY_DN83_c0_g2_i1.p2 TRINITY_DN83_c0_g2~~TRINITY_DN83_c0_g2_i1.p2  ORF type:complete len:112 (-),score=20.15 TRINITY_DN83_c0_g2_i1:396-731(-)
MLALICTFFNSIDETENIKMIYYLLEKTNEYKELVSQDHEGFNLEEEEAHDELLKKIKEKFEIKGISGIISEELFDGSNGVMYTSLIGIILTELISLWGFNDFEYCLFQIS